MLFIFFCLLVGTFRGKRKGTHKKKEREAVNSSLQHVFALTLFNHWFPMPWVSWWFICCLFLFVFAKGRREFTGNGRRFSFLSSLDVYLGICSKKHRKLVAHVFYARCRNYEVVFDIPCACCYSHRAQGCFQALTHL